jgi:hypothetical protein
MNMATGVLTERKDIHDPEFKKRLVDELHRLEVPRCPFHSDIFGDLSPICHLEHDLVHYAGDTLE